MMHRRGTAFVEAYRPAQGETVVITTVGEHVAAIDSVNYYDRVIMNALEFADAKLGAVKVLPMTLFEAALFCGVPPAEFMSQGKKGMIQ